MRSQVVRSSLVASRSIRCRAESKRAFTQYARCRESQPPTPHYEPPTKSNDPRLSRFAKILGVGIGCVVGIGYSAYKAKNAKKTDEKTADGFTKYQLVDREEISPSSSIFTLQPTSGTGIPTNDPSLARAITSVQFKQPQLQIARSYTLLPSTPGQDPRELRFLIRKERNGEVSGYLHRLAPGAEVEMRGPSAEYVLPDDVGKIVFLAGGTGIAPAMQAAKAAAGKADVHILWANKRREDCVGGKSDTAQPPSSSWSEMFAGWFSPFGTPSVSASQQETTAAKKGRVVRMLEELKGEGGGRMAVDYFVDEEGSVLGVKDATRLVRSSFSPDAGEGGRKVVFVSGPEGFVKHWAGPKEWANGREVQGPLGGVWATLQLQGWEVVKL